MAILKTRPLDRQGDWNFFHDRHPVSPVDREAIRPLEEASSRSLWKELISADPRQRHPMLLPQGHWVGNLVATGPDWRASWNDSEQPDAVSAFLRSRITWDEVADVYFYWMRERSVRMPWGVFLRTWRNCLFSEEGPFLVRLQHPEFVVFGPTGLLAVGHRAATDGA